MLTSTKRSLTVHSARYSKFGLITLGNRYRSLERGNPASIHSDQHHSVTQQQGSLNVGRPFSIAADVPMTTTPKLPHFSKILIANRGEIACRVIRTAQKLGIRTVAVYSEVDANSLHVKMADESFCIGPASSAESYLRIDAIIDACKRSGAEAVHPGYGFLSENAQFAEALAAAGIVFIGPPPSAIISMGSKSESKNIMIDAGVPCVPGYHGTNQEPSFLATEAEKTGYPVLIKAIHGGGGKGMRVVHVPDQFLDALESAKREAMKSFGNDDVLIERYISHPRHIEVQVFADSQGHAVSMWERDCSVQRRNQKIIEEAPAPGLSDELRADLSAKAVAAAQAVGYVGAGTVEFIFDNDNLEFFFMEMNTRLQVEHPVTEMVTGLDLVEWQLEVAAGNTLPLPQSAIPLIGHAFECRIYAEKPRNNFLPDAGLLLFLSTPAPTSHFAPSYSIATYQSSISALHPIRTSTEKDVRPSLRIEQGFEQGAQIGVYYDPMIAKVITHARDRAEALRVMRKALEEYKVVGVSTNVEFLRELSGHPAFIDGQVQTGFISKYHDELFPAITIPTSEIYAQAALFIFLNDMQSNDSSSPWFTLQARRFGGDSFSWKVILCAEEEGSKDVTIKIRPRAPGFFDVSVETETFSSKEYKSTHAKLTSQTSIDVSLDGNLLRTTIVPQNPPPAIPLSGSTASMKRLHIFHKGRRTTLLSPPPSWALSMASKVSSTTKGAIKAPMPSLVVDLRVKLGDRVDKGQVLVVLESMKTETSIKSDSIGVVVSIGCTTGELVEEGRELIDIEVQDD